MCVASADRFARASAISAKDYRLDMDLTDNPGLGRSSPVSEEYLVAFGCVVFPVVDATAVHHQWNQFLDALREDIRVQDVRTTSTPASSLVSHIDVPTSTQMADIDEAFALAKERIWCLSARDPAMLRISVPTKNQPTFGALTSTATDYLAVTNGTHFAVAWPFPASRPHPFLGGQVVRDILLEAAKLASPSAEIRAPSLAHFKIRLILDSTIQELTAIEPSGDEDLTFTAPADVAASDALLAIFRHISIELSYYYTLVGLEGALSIVESQLRDDQIELLAKTYTVTQHQYSLRPSTWVGSLKNRQLRRESRQLIARSWLGLSASESLISTWRGSFAHLMEDVAKSFTAHTLRGPLEAQRRTVEGVDHQRVVQAAQHVADQLASRSVAMATGVGLSVGLVAGLLIGLLL